MPITATSIPLIDEAGVSRWDDLRARSRLCGDAEDRDGGLTTYWTNPSGSTSLFEKEHMTLSDPATSPMTRDGSPRRSGARTST